jgi:hydroxymethylpyrimidine/phosphomethylpyrimidine kinase
LRARYSAKSAALLRGAATALTIAGSDSGGGAGIQADLATFAAIGVHGSSAVTAITAQNARRIIAVQPLQPWIIRAQLEAIFEGQPPCAIKTGMLSRAAIVKEVARFLAKVKAPVVVDPVMVASSGRPLLEPKALSALVGELLPEAALVTPNISEAQTITGRRIREPEDMRDCAFRIHRAFGCAALVKGGHLKGMKEAMDVFYDGKNELLLTAPFIRGVKLHGTGCRYSAAIAAYLAFGNDLPTAVTKGKEFISEAIARTRAEQ